MHSRVHFNGSRKTHSNLGAMKKITGGIRVQARNKYTTLLVFASVYDVPSTGIYPKICTGGYAL
jgi:hypothetical protein